RRHELLVREVAGGAEDDEGARVGGAPESEPFGERVLLLLRRRGRGHCPVLTVPGSSPGGRRRPGASRTGRGCPTLPPRATRTGRTGRRRAPAPARPPRRRPAP